MKARPFIVLALATFFVALACGNPTLYVYTVNADDAVDPSVAKQHRLVIRDAAKKAQLKVKVVDEPLPGAVELKFTAADAGVCGVALERIVGFPERPVEVAKGLYENIAAGDLKAAYLSVADCSPRAWSCADANALAHELGHVLGLWHEDGTAMSPDVSDAPFTERQRFVMHAMAVGFAEACLDGSPDSTDPREP